MLGSSRPPQQHPSGKRTASSGALLDDAATRQQLDRARSGDGAALEDLLRALRPEVQRLCQRMLGGRLDAADATNEALLRVQRSLSTYDDARRFRSWALSIAGNHCVDRLRRKSREGRLFSDADFDESQLAGSGPSPLDAALFAESRTALVDALDGLPERYRAPLVLRYFGDLDYAEIAEALEISRSQVATLLFRAKRRLREHFGESLEESP